MRSLAIALVSLGLALPAFAGAPLPLTGQWVGSINCKTETVDGKGKQVSDPVTLLISQVGPSGPLVVNLISKGSGAYSGTIAQSNVKPNEGTGALIACGTSDGTATSDYNEITTFHYKVGADGSGSIKSSGVFVINAVETGVCKGSFVRVGLLVKTAPCP